MIDHHARGNARMFRMTVSTFHYNEKDRQLSEYEHYIKIARTGDTSRIRVRLAEKGRQHFRRWLRRTGIALQREIQVNFELEQAARRQQKYATVRRFVLRRVNRRWVAEELKAGKMRYSRRPRKRA